MDLNSRDIFQVPSRSVIFDLDGTLIDSQESILNAIESALNECGLEAKIPVTRELIGPPLIDTLAKIIAIKDPMILNVVANKFKLHYDAVSYRDGVAYPGIDNLLKGLYSQGYLLYVATNKRLRPTKKIIKHLSWDVLFTAIYSIDSNSERPFRNKDEMISALLANELIDVNSAIYIGDRIEDYEAAKNNGLRCILVDWGYGEKLSKYNDDQITACNPVELLNTIQRVL